MNISRCICALTFTFYKFLGSKLGLYRFFPNPMQAVITQIFYSSFFTTVINVSLHHSPATQKQKLEDITRQTSTTNFMEQSPSWWIDRSSASHLSLSCDRSIQSKTRSQILKVNFNIIIPHQTSYLKKPQVCTSSLQMHATIHHVHSHTITPYKLDTWPTDQAIH